MEIDMADKKNSKNAPDFPTTQFLRAVKHWTDKFVSGEARVGIFLNSLQDDAHSFCKNKDRMDEWFEFIQDFISEGASDRYPDSNTSGEVIEIDDPNQPEDY